MTATLALFCSLVSAYREHYVYSCTIYMVHFDIWRQRISDYSKYYFFPSISTFLLFVYVIHRYKTVNKYANNPLRLMILPHLNQFQPGKRQL